MIVDKIENFELYSNLNKYFPIAFNYLKTTDFSIIEAGKHKIDEENVFAIVNEYKTQASANCSLEAHKKYIDIQFLYSGSEKIGVTTRFNQTPTQKYDHKDDYQLFSEPADFISLTKGMFAIFFPDDLHMPGINADKISNVKKIVLKVKL